AQHSGARMEFFDHVPMELFVSLIARSKLMVGNSSAGIRESGYFGVPVVDVGSRQAGRERGLNVRTVVEVSADAVLEAMRAQLKKGHYPPEYVYGSGDAGKRIASILASHPMPAVQKQFRDSRSFAVESQSYA